MAAPRMLMPFSLAAFIFLVTVMSSARVKPRCSITCIPARQVWHPVSAITEEVRRFVLPVVRSLSLRCHLCWLRGSDGFMVVVVRPSGGLRTVPLGPGPSRVASVSQLGASGTPSWETLSHTVAEGPTELRAQGPRDPTIRHWRGLLCPSVTQVV